MCALFKKVKKAVYLGKYEYMHTTGSVWHVVCIMLNHAKVIPPPQKKIAGDIFYDYICTCEHEG